MTDQIKGSYKFSKSFYDDGYGNNKRKTQR